MLEYKDRGRYVGVIQNQGLGTSSQKKTPFAVFRFKVVGEVTGPNEVVEVDHEYHRDCTIYLTERTQEYALRDLSTLGFGEMYTFGQIERSHPDCISIIGKEVEFFCRHKPSPTDGKTYEEWSVALQGGGKPFEFDQVERKDIRELDGLFGLANKKKGNASASLPPPPSRTSAPARAANPPEPQPPAPWSPTDDDLPF